MSARACGRATRARKYMILGAKEIIGVTLRELKGEKRAGGWTTFL